MRKILQGIFGSRAKKSSPAALGRQLVLETLKTHPDTDRIKQLIYAGADVNVATADGITPLMGVAGNRHIDNGEAMSIVELLLSRKADAAKLTADARNNAAVLALKAGRDALASILVEAGAPIHTPNARQETVATLAEKTDAFLTLDVIERMARKGHGAKPAPI